MHRIFILFFVILSTFTISLSAASLSDNPELRKTLRVGWYEQYPYIYEKNILGISTILTGMDIELNKAITQKADFEPDFIEVPWNNQLKMLKNGEIDIILSGLESPKRLKDFRVSNPVRTETTVIYIRKDESKEFKRQTIESFLEKIQQDDLKIGVTRGEIYTNDTINSFIVNSANSKHIIAASCNFVNLRNLNNNKVAAVLVDRTAGASIVYQNDWQDTLVSCYYPNFETRKVSYLLSKKSTTDSDLININNAIKLLKSTGEYNVIVENYLFPEILNLTVNTGWYFYIVLAGTIAYCLCALRMVMGENQSLIGTLIFVSIYAIGGGALRGILTGSYPLFFIHQTVYIHTILILTAVIFMISNIYHYIFRVERKNKFLKSFQKTCVLVQRFFLTYIFDIIDAIGLAAFIVFGVIAALEAKAEPLILWGPILAMITTSGGGVLCNMLRSFKFDQTMKNMFSEISIIWGFILSLFLTRIQLGNTAITHKIVFAVIFTVIGAFLTRWLVCYFEIKSIHFLFVKWAKARAGHENKNIK